MNRKTSIIIMLVSGMFVLTSIGIGAALADTSLTIPQIQGIGSRSPFEGHLVITEGVVTLINAFGSGMWIQDPFGDSDPATSDGIFVDDRNRLPDPKPEVGDLVRVTAKVEEQQFGNALSHRYDPFSLAAYAG